jgi:hypothetical protein
VSTSALRHALQRTPPHLVLLLRPARAELHLARGGALAAVTAEGFPLVQSGPPPGSPGNGEDLGGFLARVDEAFGRVRAAHPSPMVLAGPLDLVTAFADWSHNLYRLAGVVTGRAAESPDALSAAARGAVEPYLLSREAEALWTLQHALTAQPERVVRGLDACRAAVRRERPELLVTEETTARAEAGVVAGLIETVIARGGWVALAHDGALEPHGGIVLVLNPATAVGTCRPS